MIFRVASTVTLVANGGSSSRLCQPSSKPTRTFGSYRPDAFESAPRPRRRSRSIVSGAKLPAGASRDADGVRRAEERAMANKITCLCEQNKNTVTEYLPHSYRDNGLILLSFQIKRGQFLPAEPETIETSCSVRGSPRVIRSAPWCP